MEVRENKEKLVGWDGMEGCKEGRLERIGAREGENITMNSKQPKCGEQKDEGRDGVERGQRYYDGIIKHYVANRTAYNWITSVCSWGGGGAEGSQADQRTHVCVPPLTNTSTSICLAIDDSASRSPVGIHWCPGMTPILIGE